MPAVLDLAIGLVFVFLLFSLVASALNEVILSYLDRRAVFLREGLIELFRDRAANADKTITAERFLQHGLIAVLSRGKYAGPPAGRGVFARVRTHLRRLAGGGQAAAEEPGAVTDDDALKRAGTSGVPSYIPGKSFVLALLSLVTDGRELQTINRETIQAIGNTELKATLLALYDDAKGDLDVFKGNIENWFNESMDRVSGWYKRYAQQWLLCLSFGLAVSCNIDSVRIIRALSVDPKLRESIVAQAEAYAKDAGATAATRVAPAGAPPIAAEPTAATGAAAADDAERKIDTFKRSLAALGGTGVPMGWSDAQSQQLLATLPTWGNATKLGFWSANLWTAKTLDAIGAWLASFVGWSVSALAASLGAPFWFDTLNRFVDIRGVGRAPEEKDPTAPKKPRSERETYLDTGDSLAAARQNSHTETPPAGSNARRANHT